MCVAMVGGGLRGDGGVVVVRAHLVAGKPVGNGGFVPRFGSRIRGADPPDMKSTLILGILGW